MMLRLRTLFAISALAVVGPTLVVPVSAWHHHHDASAGQECAACVAAQLAKADGVAVQPTISDAAPVGMAPLWEAQVASAWTPLDVLIRGPPL